MDNDSYFFNFNFQTLKSLKNFYDVSVLSKANERWDLALLTIYNENPQNINREIYIFIQSVTNIFDLNPLGFYFLRVRSQSEENQKNPWAEDDCWEICIPDSKR